MSDSIKFQEIVDFVNTQVMERFGARVVDLERRMLRVEVEGIRLPPNWDCGAGGAGGNAHQEAYGPGGDGGGGESGATVTGLKMPTIQPEETRYHSWVGGKSVAIPEGIRRMARAVEDYMATQTTGDWEFMGIRNRFPRQSPFRPEPKEPSEQEKILNTRWEIINEQRQLLDWAETILMSAQHDPSVRASDWLDARKAWQEAKHNPDKSIKGKPDPIRSSPEPDCQPQCGCDQTQPKEESVG